jgi:phosphoglycerate dehydrogenase-like enzyme
MPKPKVLAVCPPDHYLLRNLDGVRQQADLIVTNQLKQALEQGVGAQILMHASLAGSGPAIKEIWPSISGSVQWIHSLSAGVEKLLTPEIAQSPVVVTNARGVFKRPLAEFAVLGVLYFSKQLRRLVRNQTSRVWEEFSVDLLDGKTLGVAGYGEIGRECAMLLKPFGMRVIATRRRPERAVNDTILDRAFAATELHAMLSECDVVVAAAPHTPDTHHMFDDGAFAAMKRSSIFINVGRGTVVDEAALIRALQSGQIAGAALDVFEVEPLPKDSPLWGFDNVLISPHCTDRTHDPDWLDLSARLFVKNFERFSQGGDWRNTLENIVDKHAGY